MNQSNSNRGGARKGAGRKPGGATRKTREIADAAAEAGITPLEVILEAMHKFRSDGDLEKAASFARDAAPYMHPRLAAVEHSGPNGGPIQTESKLDIPSLTDDQLRALASIPVQAG